MVLFVEKFEKENMVKIENNDYQHLFDFQKTLEILSIECHYQYCFLGYLVLMVLIW